MVSAIFCIVGAIWWVSFNVVILLRWENIWLNIRHPKQSTFWRQAFRRCCTKHSVTKHLIDNWHKSLFGWKVGLYICPQELSAPRDDQFSGANVTNWLSTSVQNLTMFVSSIKARPLRFFFYLCRISSKKMFKKELVLKLQYIGAHAERKRLWRIQISRRHLINLCNAWCRDY